MLYVPTSNLTDMPFKLEGKQGFVLYTQLGIHCTKSLTFTTGKLQVLFQYSLVNILILNNTIHS